VTTTRDRNARGDLLPVLREDRSARVAVAPAFLVVCLVHDVTGLHPALLEDGLGDTAASLLTLLTIAVTVASIAALVAFACSSHFTQVLPLATPLPALGFVIASTIAIYGVASSEADLPRGIALAIAWADAAVMFTALRAHIQDSRASRAYRLITLGHPQRADDLIDECRAELLDPSLGGDERSALELLMASAIADRAMLVERYDDLPEAELILARSLPAGSPAGLVSAAISVGQAIVARARQTEDVDALQPGIDLVAATIEAVPSAVPMMQRLLLLAHASGLVMLRTKADADGDAATALRHLEAAIDDEERALKLTRWGSADRADLMIELASITWLHPQRGGLDASIARCRRALNGLRARRMHVRETGCLVLADLLVERALTQEERAGADLAEAIRLCQLVARRGRRGHRGLLRLPVLLDATDADEAVVADAFKRAYEALCAVDFGDAGALAADWATWAERCCFTTQAAEAHLCWIRAVATESQRLRLRGEQQRPQWEMQAFTADAGFWLLAAGRARDAALTLELGCGILLSERVHHDRGEIGARLTVAGREDLAERWLEIGEGMLPEKAAAGDVRRDRFGASTVRIGGQSFRGRFASRDFLPLAAYERLVRQISRIPGFEDVDAPPTYEDLREAAGEGPLVYLAVAAQGAFAVVVTEDAPEPVVVALPGLTDAEVWARSRACYFDVDDDAGLEALLQATLDWLWRYVHVPLAGSLPPAALVTLVTVGAMGMLPIHAAGGVRRADGGWRDRTGGCTFRYAPNARRLARAQAIARSSTGPHVPVVSIPAAAAPMSQPPLQAIDHSYALTMRFGDDEVVRQPVSSAVEDVLGALAGGEIWHFGCGLDHDPVDPLSSRLQLAYGPLSLRQILSPDRHMPRLAVLSACETTLPGDADLDELVSLADALVQAGAAGVVSSPGVVDERAALLLVLAFLQRFFDGGHPARAFAEAQAWLASATNREIAELHGALHGFRAEQHGPRAAWERRREFSDPSSWALFSYCGA
jgi:hypothetical protein